MNKKSTIKNKPRLFLLFFLLGMHALYAATLSKEEKKAIKKEAREAAEEYNHIAWDLLKSLYKNGSESFTVSLSDNDPLSPEEAKARCKSQDFPKHSQDIQQVLSAEREADVRDHFPEEKKESQEKALGLFASDQKVHRNERYEICEEGSINTHTFIQERQVSYTPALKKTEKTCLGHKKDFSAWTKNGLKEAVEKFKKDLEKKEGKLDFTYQIDSSFINLVTSYNTTTHWKHLQIEKGCQNCHTQEILLQAAQEIDTWSTLPCHGYTLSDLEENTHCSLLQAENLEGGTRVIHGIPISRDSWKRRLTFTCRAFASSKCERLREQGGILMERKCLKQNGDECALWQKTYDMGCMTEQKHSVLSENSEILFNEEDFETAYIENTEFGEVVANLMAASSLGDQEDPHKIDFDKTPVFTGNESKCRRSFDSENIFDCCYDERKSGQGLCISAHLGKCSEEEKDLYRSARDGKCHYIGKQDGTFMTKHVYCCFPTKLARILQEEGRKQLGMGWGDPKKPLCQGLSFKQLTTLDFSQMDLSEFVEDFREKISEETLSKKLKKSLQEFSGKISLEEAQQKTRNLLSPEIKKIEETK
jgi:conjugal transfer mating pair stabilization protein TraN